jgi:hypothetical protein
VRAALMAKKRATKVWALGTPSSALIGLTETTGMGADAFTWADGRPLGVDKFGNLFGIIEDGATNHWWLWKNVGGAWARSASSWPSLTRGTVAYDAANNIAHVLWSTTQANGGIVYRRYVIAYNGSNQITGIAEDTGATIAGVVQARTNVVLDDGTGIASYEHPGLIFLGDAAYGSLGALFAFWGCQNAAGNEVRCTMLNFNGVGAQAQTLANWAAPITADTTSLGANTAPAVAYSKVFASANVGLPYVGAQRKAAGTHAKDVYLWYHDGSTNAATSHYQYRRAQWNAGASNWSTGLTTAVNVTLVVRSGTNYSTGYNTNRVQLITRPTESTSGDCMFMAALTWKDDTTGGDTWTLYKIDSADAITSVDVFSFGASSNTTSGPWGDAAFDNTKGQLIVTYNNTSNFPQMQTRNNAMAVLNTSVQLWSVVNGFDIACLLEGGSTNGTIWVVNRDTAAAHNGYAISVAWQ